MLPALVQSVRTIVTKSGRSAGQKMGILMLEDTTGTAEAVMFSNVFGQFGHLVAGEESEGDKPVFVMGRVDHSRGDPQIIVDKLVPIDGQPLEKGRLLIALRGPRLNGSAEPAIARVRELLTEHDPAAMNGANGEAISDDAPSTNASDRFADASVGEAVFYDLVVETESAFVTLSPESKPRVRLVPRSSRTSAPSSAPAPSTSRAASPSNSTRMTGGNTSGSGHKPGLCLLGNHPVDCIPAAMPFTLACSNGVNAALGVVRVAGPPEQVDLDQVEHVRPRVAVRDRVFDRLRVAHQPGPAREIQQPPTSCAHTRSQSRATRPRRPPPTSRTAARSAAEPAPSPASRYRTPFPGMCPA